MLRMGAMQGPGGQSQDCGTCLRNIWEKMGMFSRFILCSTFLVTLLGFAFPQVTNALVCLPYMIAFKFQVWRLITGLFEHVEFFMFLVSVSSYLPQAMEAEQKIGTVKMFQRFLMLGITINLIFTLICVIGGFKTAISIGLWPLLFAEIVIDCMQNPEMEKP